MQAMADYIYEKKPFPNRSFENKMIKIYLCHKLVFSYDFVQGLKLLTVPHIKHPFRKMPLFL